MFKKIKHFFYNNFSSPELPFEYRAYSIFFFLTIILSIISYITNLIIHVDFIWTFFQLLYLVTAIVAIFLPLKTRIRIFKPLLLIAALLYLPYMYFPTAGSQGTSLLFVALGILMMSIVFGGWQRKLYITINICTYLLLVVIEYFFPDVVIPFVNDLTRFIDLFVATIIAFGGFAIASCYVSNAYQDERNRISKLMMELESNNLVLEKLSIHDSLTGAFNRRYFVQHINDAIEKWPRVESQMYLILFDIDKFKKINDIYGHLVGDEILVDFVKAIQANLRVADFVARYGGEEFVVVVTVDSLERALSISERIRVAVSELEFCDGLKITVSAGVTKYVGGESYESLLERADNLLYKAKKHGRNCTFHE